MTHLIKEFIESLNLEGKSSHTIRAYRIDLKDLFLNLKVRGIAGITPSEIRSYFRNLQDMGKAASSINRKIASTKSFFSFLLNNKYLKENPMIHIKSIKLQKNRAPGYLTVNEMDRLLDQPRLDRKHGLRDITIIMLIYNTGVRAGECCKLTRKDVSIPLRGDGELKVTGKGNKVRFVPLNLKVRKILTKYLDTRQDEKNALFLSKNGESFSTRGLRKLVNRYLSRAGIGKSGVHLLRHTFASHSLKTNQNIRALQEILGHESITSTVRYTHIDREDLRKQVENLPVNEFR